MIETKVETIIHKPVTEVYAYVRNMLNQTSYNQSILAVEAINKEATEYKIQIDLGIFKLNEIYKINEAVENKLIIASCTANGMKFTDRYEFLETGKDCQLTILDKMELKGLFQLSEGLVKMNLKSQMKENLHSLKKILETKI
ncbi:polyketide cyclase/dehydrase and lipid transport [Leptospira bouyouniensis]|uniref:Polyketide cyclase/dehydrase and lipid transport n=1 Tax=Leptospira bouyouniensis TaxID=2484911 RepID=A0ABY2L790_9LEPT|nr:polyketide cyclase/dehydrase and lipid transport [Leptospira bouyouniensis]TGK52523.1 polyketide cyclase/dehydrase and lipid transport [Leptospira bouyouniensis]